MFQYNSLILKHFYQAKFAGELDRNDPRIISAEVGDADSSCVMQLFLEVNEQYIVNAKFKTYGCPAAIATLDWLCECLVGKNLAEFSVLTAKFIAEQLQLPTQKYYCALMAEDLLQKIRIM